MTDSMGNLSQLASNINRHSRSNNISSNSSERQSRVAQVSATNAESAANRQQISADTLEQSSSIVDRLNVLATRATDSTLSAQDRSALQTEADALREELNVHLQDMEGAAQTTYVGRPHSYQDANGSEILDALSTFDLSDATSAQAAVDATHEAKGDIIQEQVTVGSNISALSRAASTMDHLAAQSQANEIQDAIDDYLSIKQAAVQQKAAIKVYQAAVETEKNLMSMIDQSLTD